MVQPRAPAFDEAAMDSLWEEVIERCSDLLLVRPHCTVLLVRRAQVSGCEWTMQSTVHLAILHSVNLHLATLHLANELERD